MKRCRKTRPEPPCLTAFRSHNPNATWDQFRNNDQGCYSTVRATTRQDQRALCAYCELDLNVSNEQIAHFHPKSATAPPGNWALSWSNMLLACKGGTAPHLGANSAAYAPPLPQNRSCDEAKGNTVLTGKILRPTRIPAFPRIFSFRQHSGGVEICPDDGACGSARIPVAKVQNTITQLIVQPSKLMECR